MKEIEQQRQAEELRKIRAATCFKATPIKHCFDAEKSIASVVS